MFQKLKKTTICNTIQCNGFGVSDKSDKEGS